MGKCVLQSTVIGAQKRHVARIFWLGEPPNIVNFYPVHPENCRFYKKFYQKQSEMGEGVGHAPPGYVPGPKVS